MNEAEFFRASYWWEKPHNNGVVNKEARAQRVLAFLFAAEVVS